jgi:hypothetical protein
MRALVLLFASSLCLASAQAGEMPKQGDESSTNYFVGLPGTGEMVGVKRTTTAMRCSTRWAFASLSPATAAKPS